MTEVRLNVDQSTADDIEVLKTALDRNGLPGTASSAVRMALRRLAEQVRDGRALAQ